MLDAMRQWPAEGVPRNGGAWLTAVAKRRAIDGWRRRERLDERYAAMARDLEEEERAASGTFWDPDTIDDDVLRLVFVACHPVLSREAQIALTLRIVGRPQLARRSPGRSSCPSRRSSSASCAPRRPSPRRTCRSRSPSRRTTPSGSDPC